MYFIHVSVRWAAINTDMDLWTYDHPSGRKAGPSDCQPHQNHME